MAAVAGIVAGTLVAGAGFSLAVDGIRGDQQLGPSASVAVSATDQPSAAPVRASPIPTATATATATAAATPSAIAAAPTPSPPPTPSVTPPPVPTPSFDGGCDDVTIDQQGTVYVNEEVVEDPWSADHGDQMPMAVLQLGARAAATSDADLCLQVDVPGLTVTGFVEICGEVIAERLAPLQTPAPPAPGPTMPPTYGEPTIDGVQIPDPMLDINSYPLLEIADVEDVPACFHVQADPNDVSVVLSLAICPSARLGLDGDLTIFVGDEDWTFRPEYVYDDHEALVIGETVDAGLDIRNYLDDVRDLVEMGVWVTPGCPWPDR